MDFSRLAANRLEGSPWSLLSRFGYVGVLNTTRTLSTLSFEIGHFQPVQLGVFTEDLASLFRSLIERTGIQVCFQWRDGCENALLIRLSSIMLSATQTHINRVVISTLSEFSHQNFMSHSGYNGRHHLLAFGRRSCSTSLEMRSNVSSYTLCPSRQRRSDYTQPRSIQTHSLVPSQCVSNIPRRRRSLLSRTQASVYHQQVCPLSHVHLPPLTSSSLTIPHTVLDQERIFERFHRVPVSPDYEINLAHCHRLGTKLCPLDGLCFCWILLFAVRCSKPRRYWYRSSVNLGMSAPSSYPGRFLIHDCRNWSICTVGS